MNIRFVTTADGSHTLYHTSLDEHYHSVHGAVQESQHVFINAGLKAVHESISPIKILEIGLGTGLNAFLTYLSAGDKLIEYTAIEAFPLEEETLSNLNYLTILKAEEQKSIFQNIHRAEWNVPVMLSEKFSLHKIKAKLQDVTLDTEFDLIYFDAFAPRVQPEMWTKDIFDQLFSATKPNGFLVTYCAKGEVKRNMKAAGFVVETLQGPPGKREMTKAIKP